MNGDQFQQGNFMRGRMTFEDKKALPELMLKQKIAIYDLTTLIDAYKKLERNRRINHGMVDLIDKAEFEGEIIGMFLDIKNMIEAKRKFSDMPPAEKEIFSDLVKLLKGNQRIELVRLIQMMSYLLRKLHELNLTNLLISEKDPFDDWKHDSV